jgi:hypothetical protein
VAVGAATTATEAEAAFSAGLARIEPLEKDAPKAIAAAATAYVAGFRAYGALLAAADYDGSRVDHDQLAAITSQVAQAQTQIETYAATTCA